MDDCVSGGGVCSSVWEVFMVSDGDDDCVGCRSVCVGVVETGCEDDEGQFDVLSLVLLQCSVVT